MAEYSRFVRSAPHEWHVQEAGEGPTLLLVHGAGGATQSWREIFPLLQRDHHVIAIDLPGQGFSRSGARNRLGLDDMTTDLERLIVAEGWRFDAIIGHSAGAAIALRLAQSIGRHDLPIIGLNAALSRFEGVAGWLFPALAKLLAMTPFASDGISAAAATPGNIRRLVEGTGSHLPPEALELYLRLMRDRSHVDGTLAMMAQWSVDELLSDLPSIDAPVLLMTGDQDLAVPPKVSALAASRLPQARHLSLAGLGHLMHEEAPDTVLGPLTDFLHSEV